jgi:hypothetical protein
LASQTTAEALPHVEEVDPVTVADEYYDPVDEENYMTYGAEDEGEGGAFREAFPARRQRKKNNDESDNEDDENENNDEYSEEENDRRKVKKRYQPKLPSIKKQKKLLGYAISESSGTDLYSTDEERPDRHKRFNEAQGDKDALNSSFQPSEICNKCRGRNQMPYIEFEISADGVQLHKHAVKCAAWPLMGQIIFISPCIHLKNKVRFYMPRNSHPVIIGFYYGTKKPICANSYLECIFKEMALAEKRGLCTCFLRFYVGDGPSRQFIKGFPSSNAYCGCERYVIAFFN